jgi:hypothetical protein
MTFALVVHLHQHQSSCNMVHTLGSDHPPVLEPHMALNLPLDECIDNTHVLVIKRKGTERKQLKEPPTSD